MAVNNIPTTIRIGPYDYTVIVDSERIKELERETSSELYGITSPGILEIALQPNVADMVLRETLLHELIHALFYNTGISERFTDKTEEQIVRALSPALFSLLRDNPALVACIMGDSRSCTNER